MSIGQTKNKRQFVKSVRQEIEAARGTRIWDDYINALRLISQVVFTRSSGFVLELIQNAEDAGLDLATKGEFEIRMNEHRVKITHNGRPFSQDDVKSLCGIHSSKKPEKGTLGYLGIGFKSVFKVTDRPEVYSGGYQFKFDRSYKDWVNPTRTPWHVLPIWIDEPSEPVDRDKTTFIFPFRDQAVSSGVTEEIGKLKTELYLFLKWLKKVNVVDEVFRRTWTIENAGETESGIATLRHDGREQRFKFFRRVVGEGMPFPMPDIVKTDRLTQEYRPNVRTREVVIAFALDQQDDLDPRLAGTMFGGVYSFLPLGEAKSGANFPIQADFLVQPGRDAINYEAPWNHWLVEQVAELCEEAIVYFKNDPKWKYQFLPAFEFAKSGDESYKKLFGPKLIQPLTNFLDSCPCVPTTDGGCAKHPELVRLTEGEKAGADLVEMSILKPEELAPVLGGQPGLKLVDSRVKELPSRPIRKVDRLNLLDNEDFIAAKAKQADGAVWFRNLYFWLHKHPKWTRSRRGNSYQEPYNYSKIVLAADNSIHYGKEVWLPDVPPPHPLLRDLAQTLQLSRVILHPDILGGAASEEEQKMLRDFLLGMAGVQLLDNSTICRETLLPKIATSSTKPEAKDLVQYSRYCQQTLGANLGGVELWVLSKQKEVKAAKEVIFSKEFGPTRDWETNARYVLGLSFLNPEYLEGSSTPDHVAAWRQFFKAGRVREDPDNGVEDFAVNFVKEKLAEKYSNLVSLDKRNFGYDLEGDSNDGKVHIEVKGLTKEADVELTPNEMQMADTYKDSYYLCVVFSVPENPEVYMVRNPSAPEVGKKDRLTIPANIWKAAKWPSSSS